jgi:hypothetical protein
MTDPELSHAALRLLVSDWHNTHDGNLGSCEATQNLSVQPSQVGREQNGATVTGGDGSQQVGHVDAPTNHSQTAVSVFQCSNEPRLPPGAGHRRQNRNRHSGASGTTVR